MQGIRSIWRSVRLIGSIALTLAAASGPPSQQAVRRTRRDRPDHVARSARLGRRVGIRAFSRVTPATWGPGVRAMGEGFS